MGEKGKAIITLSIINIINATIVYADVMMQLSAGLYQYQGYSMVSLVGMLISFVTYIIIWVMVAKDIKARGISWAFMVLPILLSGIGGLAYWLINCRGKQTATAPPATPAKAV